ncbi:hypothetical protein EDD11_001276 [Mortierella claussenii]|nr:hypothetical protein EDD11_001276 [Mortierella claussenii]
MLDEARKTLEPMHPFNENPLLVGYAGLTEFALWSRATRESRLEARQEGHLDPDELVNTMEQEQESDDWFDEEDSERSNANQWRSSISKYGRSAANLLEQALRISPKNDTFLVYLVRLKCGKIDLAGLGSKKISRRRKKAIHEMRIYLKRHYSNNNDSVLSLQLLAALENREKLKTLELILSHDPASDSRLYMQPLLQLLWSQIPNDQQILIDKIKKGQASAERELDHKAILSSLPTQAYESRRTKAWFRRTIPFFNAPPPPSLTKSQVETASTFLCHQPEVKHLRPILQILLTRAEFGFLTEEEEQDLVRTCDLFCFCSLYCQRLKSMEDMLQAPKSVSSFDDLPEHQQPAWYGKLAAILRRPDTP